MITRNEGFVIMPNGELMVMPNGEFTIGGPFGELIKKGADPHRIETSDIYYQILRLGQLSDDQARLVGEYFKDKTARVLNLLVALNGVPYLNDPRFHMYIMPTGRSSGVPVFHVVADTNEATLLEQIIELENLSISGDEKQWYSQWGSIAEGAGRRLNEALGREKPFQTVFPPIDPEPRKPGRSHYSIKIIDSGISISLIANLNR